MMYGSYNIFQVSLKSIEKTEGYRWGQNLVICVTLAVGFYNCLYYDTSSDKSLI